MSHSPLKKKRDPVGVPCLRAVLRFSALSDGAFRTFMCIKARAKHGIAIVKMKEIAKERGCGRDTILNHVKECHSHRLLSIQPRSSRGMQHEHAYLIDDVHFAQFLAKKTTKTRCRKKPTPVPSVLEYTRDPLDNVIPLPDQKICRL
jgi:hypothetical protein